MKMLEMKRHCVHIVLSRPQNNTLKTSIQVVHPKSISFHIQIAITIVMI